MAPNVALTPLPLGKAGPLSPSVPGTSHPSGGEPPGEEANCRPRKRRATEELQEIPGGPEAPGGPCPPAATASKPPPPPPLPPPPLLPPPDDKDSEVEIEVESRDECKLASG